MRLPIAAVGCWRGCPPASDIRSLPSRSNTDDPERFPAFRRGLFFVTGTAAVMLGLNTYGGLSPYALFLEALPWTLSFRGPRRRFWWPLQRWPQR